MAKLLKLRGGTTSQHSSFTGASREVTVDTDKDTLVVHDGSQAGGFPLARADGTGTSNFTITGELDAGSLDISGNADIDGTLEADAITLNGTALGSLFSPIAGGSGIVTTGAIDSGSITSNFGNIDNGTSTLTTGNSDINGTLNVQGETTLQTHLNMGDDDKIKLGDAGDLEIYHNGTHSIISDEGTGNLILRGSNELLLGTTAGQDILKGTTGGDVKLYHNNSEKFATTSDGVSVTGNMLASGVIGLDTTDYLQFTNSTRMDIVVNNSNEFRFESDGDFHADGDVIAFSTTVSDERLKTDIQKIENATDKISQINGYTFTYKEDGKKSAGVIAQELEKVLPSAVSEKELLKKDDGVTYKTVHYDQIIGLLVESIKELKQEINELKGA